MVVVLEDFGQIERTVLPVAVLLIDEFEAVVAGSAFDGNYCCGCWDLCGGDAVECHEEEEVVVVAAVPLRQEPLPR